MIWVSFCISSLKQWWIAKSFNESFSPTVLRFCRRNIIRIDDKRRGDQNCKEKMEDEKWGNLPAEVLTLIAQCAPHVVDVIRMGAVCRSWRTVSLEMDWHPLLRPSPAPWLMLSDEADSDTCLFYHPTTKKTFSLSLPVARKREWFGLGSGWLLVVDDDLDMHLLHPLSQAQVRLPAHATLDTSRPNFIRVRGGVSFGTKAAFTCPPVGNLRDCLVLVIVHVDESGYLASARPGDAGWRRIETPFEFFPDYDVVYHRGKFYVSDLHWKVMVLAAGGEQVAFLSIMSPHHLIRGLFWYRFSVVVGDTLMVLLTAELLGNPPLNPEIRLLKHSSSTSFYSKKWTEVNDLGDYCLFVGHRSLSYLSQTPIGCKKNSIYFIDGNVFTIGTRGNIVEYSLGDGSFTIREHPGPGGQPRMPLLSPIWLKFDSPEVASPAPRKERKFKSGVTLNAPAQKRKKN